MWEDGGMTTTNPVLQVVRHGDEHVSVHFEGKELITANHDSDGFGGMAKIIETARTVAEALGATVQDAVEPNRQKCKYFVTYFYNMESGFGFGNHWIETDRSIEDNVDLEAVASRIREDYPSGEFDKLIILDFKFMDGPL
jgi:hypothetical protein